MADTPEDIPHLFAKAWNARDAHALASLFVEDADFVNVVGLWWHNRDDIERAHHYGLTTFFQSSEISPRRIKVRQVSDDIAIIHTRWRLRGQLGKEGEQLDTRFAIMMFVAERQRSGWAVLAAQNTDIVPGAETNTISNGTMRAADYRK
ncbi:SgcJ/EcaC family oxidoreductase [Shimia sp. R9_3]|uniref:SgcJ/EcaC family oxidoreductase n=1 Tax=Shimia sp. R9_3 TaxID=2821113 RepID=UPI001ADB3996|nr:SgcJ/EcaC family oxidoreductase [Shimia sp. R9_3]MBO9401161.1 SgcJ/EcaC family oxidoreductase [Shimia sp. R9_3]